MTTPFPPRPTVPQTPEETFTWALEALQRAERAISALVIGQEEVVEKTLITLLSGGHALMVGVPGLAKTMLVKTVGQVLGLDSKRVQFTPDLMPSDILGIEVLEENAGQRHFRFIEGPVFSQILMADEINRASPRTQSALLQAMQEFYVTVGGKRYDLPRPFHVLATQNPLDQEGTYPLPEAQLDRFMMEIVFPYPDAATERAILLQTTTTVPPEAVAVIRPDDLLRLQELVRHMPVGEKLVDSIVRLVRSARPRQPDAHPLVNDTVAWGPGPRVGQALMLAVRARALLHGRGVPLLEDILALAPAMLRHRMTLNYRAKAAGYSVEDVIRVLLEVLSDPAK